MSQDESTAKALLYGIAPYTPRPLPEIEIDLKKIEMEIAVMLAEVTELAKNR
jgi:hypothetical protein